MQTKTLSSLTSLSLSHGVRRPNDVHRISTSSPINTELRESLVNTVISIGHVTPNVHTCTHTHMHTYTHTHTNTLTFVRRR